jgi:hypothetical protein
VFRQWQPGEVASGWQTEPLTVIDELGAVAALVTSAICPTQAALSTSVQQGGVSSFAAQLG